MGADARVDVLLALKAKLEGFDGAATAVPNLSRAVNQAGVSIRQQTRSIGAEVDSMSAKLKGAFSPSALAKGFLAGAGAGSGAALVGLTISKWAQVWKDSAEYAKDLQARAESIATAMQATARAAREAFVGTLGPEAQRAARLGDVSAAEARMAAAEARRAKSLGGIGWITDNAGSNPLGLSNIGVRVKEFGGEKFGTSTGMGGRDFIQLMQERADAAQLEWNQAREDLIKARSQVAALDKDIAAVAAKTAAADLDSVLRQAKLVGRDFNSEKNLTPEQEVAAADAASRAITEMREEEIEAAEKTRRAEAELWADRAKSGRDALREQIESGNRIFMEQQEANRKLTDEAKAFNRELAQMWNSVSDRAGQAFADILLEGKNSFRALGHEISRSILEITARMAVINPILNAVFGSFGGYQKLPTFGTAKAAGGGQFLTSGPTQFTVGDNPGGVELVSVLPLSGVGRSSINGRSLAMAGGGSALVGGMGGGDTFHFTYSFAGGVSRQEVLGLIPTLVEASKGAVLEAKRRRRDGFRG